MSIGYSNPISGSGGFSIFVRSPTNSGGAIQGWMPQQTQNVDKRYPEFEQIRFTLKEAWNTTYPSQLRRNNLKYVYYNYIHNNVIGEYYNIIELIIIEKECFIIRRFGNSIQTNGFSVLKNSQVLCMICLFIYFAVRIQFNM